VNGIQPLVCDASVVLNLGRRGGLTRLIEKVRLNRRLVVTAQVEAELCADEFPFYTRFLADHFEVLRGPLPMVHTVLGASSPHGLDAGEVSVLALCLDQGWVPAIDERLGRQVARKLGLEPIGTFGLLQIASVQGSMTDAECIAVVQRLRVNGFYCPKVMVNQSFPDYLAALG
jgi:predicted nucleic acid-binding protein